MKLRALLLATGLLLSATAASAVTFDILDTVVSNGHTPTTMSVGDTLTVRLRINNSTNVFGLGASAFNYTEAVLDFQSGQAVNSINHATCIPAVGCFNGLGSPGTSALTESAIGSSGNRVQIFNQIVLSPATNTNPQDPGLDGVVGGGDAQVRIVFVATGNGSTVLKLGTGYNGDGEILAGGVTVTTAETTVAVTVPEPASIAAGLAALGTVAAAVTVRRRL